MRSEAVIVAVAYKHKFRPGRMELNVQIGGADALRWALINAVQHYQEEMDAGEGGRV